MQMSWTHVAAQIEMLITYGRYLTVDERNLLRAIQETEVDPNAQPGEDIANAIDSGI